jgi:hypothetical protein
MLSLLVLGIRNDASVGPHPRLPDGVHLRWFLDPDLGFPWYGYYLFRRESRPSRPRCLSWELRRFQPGPFPSTRLDTTLGRLSSTKALVFTDDFPASGLVEVDLASGLRFELPAEVEARRVDVRIGLRDTGPRAICADFRALPLGVGPSPRTEKGADFEVEPPPFSPSIPLTSIEQWGDSPHGLQCTRRLEVALPCPASRVDLLLTNRGALRIEALTATGSSAGVREIPRLALSAGIVTLLGQGIVKVTIESSTTDPALLHQVCWECPTAGQGTAPQIVVDALAGPRVVVRTIVQGNVGEIVAASLEGAGITAVEISAGPAALVDLCFLVSKQPETFGWDELKGFTYPLCLPSEEDGYPCAGKPASFEKAQELALSRVTYPFPPGWDAGFSDLHGQLGILVKGGPGGGLMADRTNPALSGQTLSPATQSDVPSIPAGLHPLELILLGSLQPAVAQMIGTYFVDTTAAADVPYDYLLLADLSGVLGGSAENALKWLAFATDHTQVEAVLTLGRKVTARPPIAPPGEGRAYALPGPATREIDGSLPKSAGNVGLWWPLPADSTTVEQPDRIVFYYPKRVSHGPLEPPTPPADAAYLPMRNGAPFLVSEPDPPNPPTDPNPRSPDWPPPSIPIHLVDGSLAEGWYSYRLAGQDLFGRRSGLGPPARWYEWTPTSERHAFAVALLDKVPPPIPLGVEAWALDPPDRWVLADQAYTAWRSDYPDLVGLRVRWRWTFLQQIQAPDTREFRIYYQPGRWNALLGRIVKVVAVATSNTESEVDLDFADSHAPNDFTGARLRVGNDDFEILGSQPGASLRLRVKNIGAEDEILPAEGKPCTVAIPETHALWVDTGLAETWAQRLVFVPYDPPLRTVFDPSKDRNGQPLTSANALFQGVQPKVSGADVYFPPSPVGPLPSDDPRDPDLSDLQPWIDHLWLQGTGNAEEAHPIVRYDANARTVTLKEVATLVGTPVAWILGRPTREYEVFLEAPDVGDGHPFEPSFAEPAVYAQIAVSAADDKIHTKDDPKWNDPDRYGNESRLSPSATVFRVLQKKPDPPELVEKFGRIFATPADYHSRSYFTFRFVPKEYLKVHVLRALDESLFRRDELIRETRTALDPAVPAHLDFFPDDQPPWDLPTKQEAATAVNALGAGAPYNGLTEEAWAVLALLPGNEAQPDRAALETRDTLVRHTRTALAAIDVEWFPSSWNEATRTLVAENLNKLTGPDDYLELSDEALRVLATLPGNEAAFTQVTLAPLDMADPTLHDERRPDDEALYAPDPALRRAYTDTLPGRAANRYFYRARFVDGAQNQSGLSGPTPPVYLPKVEPPRAPVITKVVGGDRQITIQWAANREPGLAEYRVYRTEHEDDLRDLRLMELVATVPIPSNRTQPLTWVDQGVVGRVTYRYFITARDMSGHESLPSGPVTCRAFDDAVPDPPVWNAPAPGPIQDSVLLSWLSAEADLSCLVQRNSNGGEEWQDLTAWLSRGQYQFRDAKREAGQIYSYRLKVIDRTGRINKKHNVLSV